jgi:hypothetical protein
MSQVDYSLALMFFASAFYCPFILHRTQHHGGSCSVYSITELYLLSHVRSVLNLIIQEHWNTHPKPRISYAVKDVINR